MSEKITHTKGNPPVKLAGHINWAHERGSYPGCKAVMFEGDDIDAQMNEYFSTEAHAALVVDIKPLGLHSCLVVYTKRLTDDEKAEMDEFNSHYAEWKEERKHRRLEAEEKARKEAQARIDADNKERELTKKRLEKLGKLAISHIRNCKKSPEEAKEAAELLKQLADLDKPPPPEVEKIEVALP